MRKIIKTIIRISFALIIVSLFFILTQDLQIFPQVASSIFEKNYRESSTLPKDVESIFVETLDNENIELWRQGSDSSQYVAVIFHGNAGDVLNFFPYQTFFKELGITSYDFDYRGFGKSSGWPSEAGLYLDSKAVVDYVLKREKINPKKLIFFGISIGTGPAAYSASIYEPGALILLSPYTSLPELIKDMPFFGFLHPFSFYELDTLNYVKSLNETCLIVAHGSKDITIPPRHGMDVYSSFTGSAYSDFIKEPIAGHNDLFFRISDALKNSINNCLR